MSPEQIKQLRAGLRCTARDLAATLDIPLAELQAWETGEQFPTKKWVDALERLRAAGPNQILRKSPAKKRPPCTSAQQRLASPEFWELVRKLAAYPDLFEQSAKMATDYRDPETQKND